MRQVWDIQDQNCLLTLRPKSHRIEGDIQTCHYSVLSKTLAIATEQMNALSQMLKYVFTLCTAPVAQKAKDRSLRKKQKQAKHESRKH